MASLSRQAMDLEGQLAGERARHDETRILLQQVQLAMRALEARLQHDILVQQDELDAARQATVTAQRALDETTFEVQKRNTTGLADAVPKRAVRSSVVATRAEPKVVKPKATPDAVAVARSATDAVPVKKRGRPRVHPVAEPKPVRWWTPSFRARAKG